MIAAPMIDQFGQCVSNNRGLQLLDLDLATGTRDCIRLLAVLFTAAIVALPGYARE
jgi:hypothetical protein